MCNHWPETKDPQIKEIKTFENFELNHSPTKQSQAG
jgi:hypothetical protein